jgi:hypothetical protein
MKDIASSRQFSHHLSVPPHSSWHGTMSRFSRIPRFSNSEHPQISDYPSCCTLDQAASAVQAGVPDLDPPPVNRSDPSTWVDGNWPCGVEGGILPYFGAGQSTCAWFVRSVPAVRAAFAALWRTEDLLASLDGILLWRPWRERGPHAAPHARAAHRTEAGWFHVDQNPRCKPGFCSVQGLVRLPSTPTPALLKHP